MPELSGALFVLDFDIRQSRAILATPINHARAAVDQAFVEQGHEGMADSLRALLVHRETRAAPIEAGAQAAKLHQNRIAGLAAPFPHPFQELFAA